jgi:hypothetical protein
MPRVARLGKRRKVEMTFSILSGPTIEQQGGGYQFTVSKAVVADYGDRMRVLVSGPMVSGGGNVRSRTFGVYGYPKNTKAPQWLLDLIIEAGCIWNSDSQIATFALIKPDTEE